MNGVACLGIRLQHLLGVFARGLRELGATEHSGDFFGPLFSGDDMDTGPGTASCGLLFDQVVMVGESGDLGQVGDAKDLVRPRQALELFAYRLGRPAADPGVDLVEDQGALGA